VKLNASSIQIARQTAKDTIPPNPAYDLRILAGSSLGPDREIQVKRTAEGNRVSDGIAVVGNMGAGGQINFVAQLKNLPLILYLAMGEIASSAGPDPFTHTIHPGQAVSLPWFSAWTKIDTVRYVVPNLKVNTLKLLVSAADRLVVGQMSVMGAGAVKYKTAAPVTPAAQEPVTDKYSWDMAKGAWTVDGSVVAWVHTLEINVNNNLTGIPGEDYFFYDILEGPLDLEYAAVMGDITAAKYNTLVFGSASPADDAEPAASVQTGSFTTTFTHTDSSPGPERSVAITVAASEYRNPLPKLNIDPEGKPQELRLEARCTGADPQMALAVKNGVTSYTA